MALCASAAFSCFSLQQQRVRLAAAIASPQQAAFLRGRAPFRRRKCNLGLAVRAVAAEAGGEYYEPREDYIHPRYPFSHQYNPVDERSWQRKLIDELWKLTPIKAIKISTIAALVYTLSEWFLGAVVFNPKVCMYASWALIFWPWVAAIGIGFATGYLAFSKVKGAKLDDQKEFLLLLGSLVWLILVPFAHFKGYVEGYPAIMFAVYSIYALIDTVVRDQAYGFAEPGPVDKDWIIPTNKASLVGFVGSIVVGHWLAAFEAPPLMLIKNRAWQTKFAAGMIILALAFKYFGTYFLLKYSKTVGRPNATVVFGPYRWVRHPIYGSSMMLLIGFCVAVRAYGSLALLMAGCLFYYDQLIKQEEEVLVAHFGKSYESYRAKVPRKYLPFVY